MNDNAPGNIDLEFEEVSSPESAPETPEPEVPEKYKGKSVLDIIDMHRNAERALSRQGQDLAEQRKLTDMILGLRKENAEAPETPPEPVTADEVFADPNSAIDRIIKSSEVNQKTDNLAQRLESLERGIGQKEFETRHPSFSQDAQDEKFLDWVKSNRTRTDLLARLHYNYDFNAGNDLWDMWEEYRGTTSSEPTSEVVRKARTVRNGPADTTNKPTYSRAKLLDLQARALRGDPEARLKWNDPGFQKEYIDAYREGRIK